MPARGPRRPVSMADVARRAHVSITTVSHVLNRTRSVSAEKQEAVLAAVADLGYVPDAVTRSLRTSSQRLIGLAMTTLANSYFAELASAIEVAAAQEGYGLLVSDTHETPHGELRSMAHLLERPVDAIILATAGSTEQSVAYAERRGVPLVLVDRFADVDLDQIGPESRESSALLTRHLVELGHERVGIVSGRPTISTDLERVRGFEEEMARSGLPAGNAFVAWGDNDEQGVRSALSLLLREKDPPTALVGGNSSVLLYLVRAARRLGVDIPGDLALVGFDDAPWSDLVEPPLTVMAQPTRQIGSHAVSLVRRRLEDPTAPAERVVLHPHFVHRASCGCPRD